MSFLPPDSDSDLAVSRITKLKQAQKQWREKNRERINQYHAEWIAGHPERAKLYQEKHKKRRRSSGYLALGRLTSLMAEQGGGLRLWRTEIHGLASEKRDEGRAE